jgi:hypothetical protein
MQLVDDVVTGDSMFTADELLELTELCEEQIAIDGAPDLTDTEVSNLSYDGFCCFIKKSPERQFLFNRFGEYAKRINESYFGFDITSALPQGVLYSKYDAPGRHVGWHTDKKEHSKSVASNLVRKMVVVLQLSDPSEYDGCDIEVMTDQGLRKVPKGKGTFYSIPGYVPHQVTPLISGERKALIMWFVGPPFK